MLTFSYQARSVWRQSQGRQEKEAKTQMYFRQEPEVTESEFHKERRSNFRWKPDLALQAQPVSFGYVSLFIV